MNQKQFNAVARDLFGGLLRPCGFTDQASRYATFYRQTSAEVFHIICPARDRHGDCFEVLVYPSSPVVDPTFDKHFPDELPVPTNLSPYLNEQGIGRLQLFNCRNEENMCRRFEKSIKQPLLTVAIPYLDRIETIKDMIPLLERQGPLGFALDYLGRHEEARAILTRERQRLLQLDTNDADVAASLEKIATILSHTNSQ